VNASPTEMLNANVLAYRIISARAARGLDLELFLRMQRDAHEALQPAKDEIEGDKDREPIRPVFERAPSVTPPSTGAGDDSRTTPPTQPPPLTVDGQEYE